MTEPPYLIQGIPASAVEHFWPFAEPFIKRALDHANGEFSSDNFKSMCKDRVFQLWLVSKEKRIFGAITTQIVVYPQRKHCRIITVAGSDFSNWIDLANKILDAWAKEQGCNAMEACVRKGLVPKLTTLGYKHKRSFVTKEL